MQVISTIVLVILGICLMVLLVYESVQFVKALKAFIRKRKESKNHDIIDDSK